MKSRNAPYQIHPAVQATIESARARQIAKFGDSSHDQWHDNGTWGLIAGEEFGEWCLSLLQEKEDDFDNAAHVATDMVAFMESRLNNITNSYPSKLLPKDAP